MVYSACRPPLSDQNGSDVVDVGAGRTGTNQIADPGKETIAVVRGKEGPGIKICRAGPRKGLRRDERAGGIFGSVDTVAVACKRENARLASHIDGEAEHRRAGIGAGNRSVEDRPKRGPRRSVGPLQR